MKSILDKKLKILIKNRCTDGRNTNYSIKIFIIQKSFKEITQ